MKTTDLNIQNYILSLPSQKQVDMQELHINIITLKPNAKLWFLDGKNEDGNIVANPNIGYDTYEIKYANGKSQEFYRVGISANTIGISVYIMGLADKKYLSNTCPETIGKATVSGYCIKFKTLKDIHIDVLLKVISDRFNNII